MGRAIWACGILLAAYASLAAACGDDAAPRSFRHQLTGMRRALTPPHILRLAGYWQRLDSRRKRYCACARGYNAAGQRRFSRNWSKRGACACSYTTRMPLTRMPHPNKPRPPMSAGFRR